MVRVIGQPSCGSSARRLLYLLTSTIPIHQHPTHHQPVRLPSLLSLLTHIILTLHSHDAVPPRPAPVQPQEITLLDILKLQYQHPESRAANLGLLTGIGMFGAAGQYISPLLLGGN